PSPVCHASLDAVQKVMAVGQKIGSPIRLNVGSCVDDRHRSRLAAHGVHTQNQSGAYEKDRVVRSPRAATEVGTLSDHLDRSPGSRNLLHSPCSKETYPPAV